MAVVSQDLRRPLAVLVVRTTAVMLLLTVIYFALPLPLPASSDAWRLGVRLAVSVTAVTLLVLALRVVLRRGRERQPAVLVKVERLAAALYVLALGFAYVYAVLARALPGQFAGIDDRIDSLYFSVTTLATVGFGDVHAVGDGARVVVTVQMIFDLVYVGTAVRVLSAMRMPQALPEPPAAGEPAAPPHSEDRAQVPGGRLDGDGDGGGRP